MSKNKLENEFYIEIQRQMMDFTAHTELNFLNMDEKDTLLIITDFDLELIQKSLTDRFLDNHVLL